MTTFRTIDGTIICAASPANLIVELRKRSFNPELSIPEYTKKTAAAATLQTGLPHRHDSAENLFADLITSGLIEAFQMDKKDQPPAAQPWFL
jgi:hypothetical protein